MEKIIIKYLTNSATTSEIEALEEWIKIEGNESIFKAYIEINFVSNQQAIPINIETHKAALLEKVQKGKSVFYSLQLKRVYRYAAVFIGLISLTLYLYQRDPFQEKQEYNNVYQNLSIPDDDIILRNENGSFQVLGKTAQTTAILNTNGNQVANHTGSHVKYNIGTNISEELVYNEMIVPNGKRINITLSDGSIVHLNSGSSFRFPVKFISGKTRKVFLKGEGFFEVAKHKSDAFIIGANDIDIKVLGTTFNVSSYKEDKAINTVLVEGSVHVYNTGSPNLGINLEPGQMASWYKEKGDMAVVNVNTRLYTAWITGKLVLRNTPFKIIRKKLERYYNVSIINKNKALDEQRYNVNFDNETIEQVLKTINENFNINYKITNNKIIIN